MLTVKDGILRGKDIVHLNFIKIPVFHRHLEQIIVRQNYAALQMPAILNGKVPNALGYYQGVSVFIDLDALTATPPDILSEAGINGNNLYAKFCEQKGHIAMPASEKIEHIFSELYRVPEGIQMAYFKLKIQELLLFLCMVDVRSENQRAQYMPPQVEVVKKIHKKLTANLKERPTIEELSKEYLINTSTLKETFKGIYGMPIATYMKTYRIKQAAVLLRQTQDTVADIAQQVGYINQSKFATAFREIMKISPTEYRSQYEANPKTILHD